MNPQQVAELIQAGLPGARASVRARTTCTSRPWWSRRPLPASAPLQRHQLVYATLGPAMGNEIHALALKVFTPEEYASNGRG